MPTSSSRPKPRYSRALISVAMIANSPARNSDINPRYQFAAADSEVLRHIIQNRRQCTETQRLVSRNGDVMLSALQSCQAKMATRLAGDIIAEDFKCLRQFVARPSHGAASCGQDLFAQEREE